MSSDGKFTDSFLRSMNRTIWAKTRKNFPYNQMLGAKDAKLYCAHLVNFE